MSHRPETFIFYCTIETEKPTERVRTGVSLEIIPSVCQRPAFRPPHPPPPRSPPPLMPCLERITGSRLAGAGWLEDFRRMVWSNHVSPVPHCRPMTDPGRCCSRTRTCTHMHTHAHALQYPLEVLMGHQFPGKSLPESVTLTPATYKWTWLLCHVAPQ